MNLVFALTGLLLGAYVAVAAGTNVALSGMGLLVGVINGIVMIVNGMPLWKEWQGWGVLLELTGPLSPARIRPQATETTFAIVLPMRLM
jgi:hypothetical protein